MVSETTVAQWEKKAELALRSDDLPRAMQFMARAEEARREQGVENGE